MATITIHADHCGSSRGGPGVGTREGTKRCVHPLIQSAGGSLFRVDHVFSGVDDDSSRARVSLLTAATFFRGRRQNCRCRCPAPLRVPQSRGRAILPGRTAAASRLRAAGAGFVRHAPAVASPNLPMRAGHRRCTPQNDGCTRRDCDCRGRESRVSTSAARADGPRALDAMLRAARDALVVARDAPAIARDASATVATRPRLSGRFGKFRGARPRSPRRVRDCTRQHGLRPTSGTSGVTRRGCPRRSGGCARRPGGCTRCRCGCARCARR